MEHERNERNELHVSVSKQYGGDIVINAMQDGPGSATRSIFPASTSRDVIMVRTWDEHEHGEHAEVNGRYCALDARDLWLVVQIRRAGTKRQAAALAAQLAGLESQA